MVCNNCRGLLEEVVFDDVGGGGGGGTVRVFTLVNNSQMSLLEDAVLGLGFKQPVPRQRCCACCAWLPLECMTIWRPCPEGSVVGGSPLAQP